MAGLAPAPPTRSTSWTPAQTRAQFAAIAQLRWRITANSFRRKGGAGELVGRIILFLVFAGFAFGLMAFAGSAAWYAATEGDLKGLDIPLWGTFLVCQLANIQLGQPGTVFDPTQLIRFPMRITNYVAVRLFFGLLSPANVIGVLLSLAIAIGVILAIPSLWPYALLSLAVFALTNALFSRMLFAWVDRWLSTRRAREVLTAFIFIASLGFQWANYTFNPSFNHHNNSAAAFQRITAAIHLYHRAQPFLAALPPGLIASALLAAHQGHPLAFLAYTTGCSLVALIFFAIFAWRMGIEFRGENLSDAANGVAANLKRTTPSKLAPTNLAPAKPESSRFGLRPAVFAVMGKELLQVRRNTGIFYGMIAPIVFVFIFAGKLATRSNASWVFPAALAYTLMGIAPLSYNSFGLEGAGTQFYFMAPAQIRDIFFAKNLINFALAFLEIAAVFAIISYVAIPPSPLIMASTLLWAAATLLVSTTLGNRRSVIAPKKIDLGRTASKQSSPLSSLIAFGVLLGSAAIGAAFLLLAIHLRMSWILLPLQSGFFIAAIILYLRGLRASDTFTLQHREQLFEELCKK
jgi:ABC-2 type transport system permease protein